ncbi:MAG: protein kinase [Micromonosporaceae bacterium]|nr:protein kinase [Micromonosporaceae bacterium]
MLTPGKSMGGRYRLDERIATGGMGDVWKCEDTVLGRVVALKVLQPAMLEEPGFAERFRAEARVMATINHPGVVSVYDYGEDSLDGGGNVAFLVMQYVEGEPLHRVLANAGRLTSQRAMDLIAQAANALQAAHNHGIIHRDVKPGNLLVRPNGELVLTDFGIARSALTGNLTQVGAVLGTASYVSPEQASGTGNITPASDVYSLGVVAYQCLAGRRPFEGENPIEVAMKHLRDEPPPLPPDVPDPVRNVVIRAMAKDVAQRWPDAKTMGEAARAAAAGRTLGGAAAAGAAAAGAAAGAFGGSAPAGATPGGTSVMPAVPGGPPGPGGPSGPGGPGDRFARGAASVPTSAAQGDDAYYPGDRPSGGGYGGYGQEPRKSRTPLILGVVAGALALLLGVGLVAWALSGGGEKPGDGRKSPTAKATFNLDPDEYLGKNVDQVAKKLTDEKDLNVVKKKQGKDGYQANEVTGLNPTSGLTKGDTVTLYYQPKQDGGGLPGMPNVPGPGDDDDDGDDGGDDNGGVSPPASEPSESPDPSPTTSEGEDSGIGGGFGGNDAQKDD